MTKDWFDSDERLLAQLREGHRQADLVAQRVRDDGLEVRVSPTGWGPSARSAGGSPTSTTC